MSENNDNYFDVVFNRLKEFIGTSKDAAVARELGVSRSNISTWKKKDAIPHREIDSWAIDKGISLNWIYHGFPPMMLDDDTGSPLNYSKRQMDSSDNLSSFAVREPVELKYEHQDMGSQAEYYANCVIKGLKQILLEPEIKHEWVKKIDEYARNLYQIIVSLKNETKPLDQESLEIAIECVELYIKELGLKVHPAKKAKVIRMLYPLIRDDDDNEVPDNLIDLLQLAEEVQEQGDIDEQQKAKVVKKYKT